MVDSRTSIGGTVNVNQGSINFCNLDTSGELIERGVADTVTQNDVTNKLGPLSKTVHGCPAINNYRAAKRSQLTGAFRNGSAKHPASRHTRKPIDKTCGAEPPSFRTIEIDNLTRSLDESKDEIPTNADQPSEDVSFGESTTIQDVRHGVVPVKDFIREQAGIDLILRKRDELGDLKNLTIGEITQNADGDIIVSLSPDLSDELKNELELRGIIDFINFGRPLEEVGSISSLIDEIDNAPVIQIGTLLEDIRREGGSSVGFNGVNPDATSVLKTSQESGRQPNLETEFRKTDPETGEVKVNRGSIENGAIRTRQGRIRVDPDTGEVTIENSRVSGRTTNIKAVSSDFLSQNFLTEQETRALVDKQAQRIDTVETRLDTNFYTRPVVDGFVDDLETQINKLNNLVKNNYLTAKKN